MQVAFYKSEDGDWVDLLIDGHKVYGGHSLSPQWCAKYIAKYHLRRIKMTVDGVEMPQLGYSEQEDFD